MKLTHRQLTHDLLPYYEASEKDKHKNREFLSLETISHSPKYPKKVSNSFFNSKEREKWKNLVYARLFEARNNENMEENRPIEKHTCEVSMINIFNQSQYEYGNRVELNKINMKSLLKEHQNEKTFQRRILSARNKSSLNSQSEKAPSSHRDQKKIMKFNNSLFKENSKLQKFKQQNVDELLVETKLINKKPDSFFNKTNKKPKRLINLSAQITIKPPMQPVFNTISAITSKRSTELRTLKVRKQSSFISPW